ncbi:hypothetical protein [Streptomyces sp. NPDC053048]|uniref:hypothetical protein n=1 Tax=Streptomyces sp. NPDC053048 TaxID=3365694 RepID=UPI0037D81152
MLVSSGSGEGAVGSPSVEGAEELSVGAFAERFAVLRARFRGTVALGSELVGGVSVDAEELLPGHVTPSSSVLAAGDVSTVVVTGAGSGGSWAAPAPALVGPPWREIFGMDPSSWKAVEWHRGQRVSPTA